MPGFPGPAGLAVFVGIKFSGYCLAGVALKKLQPTITASAAAIAATRTGLGVVLGPLMTLLGVFIAGLLFPNLRSDGSIYWVYLLLLPVRVLVWAFIISIFTKRFSITRSSIWIYAVWGAVWSCLLDWPAFKLAAIAPGQIPVC
jgi:hypothetical protein